MFRSILQALKARNLMIQALDLCEEALGRSELATRAALKPLLEGQRPDVDVYAIDRQINQAEVDVRRLVFEHMAVDHSTDVSAGLILTSVIIDVERVGDYAKNILQLAEKNGGPLPSGAHGDTLRAIATDTLALFADSSNSLRAGDEALAADVMKRYQSINLRCEALIDQLLADGNLSSREGIALALAARYLKRVGAHLSNLASSVVNPFDRIGFKPGSPRPVDPEDA